MNRDRINSQYWLTIEILTAFVRERSTPPPIELQEQSLNLPIDLKSKF